MSMSGPISRLFGTTPVLCLIGSFLPAKDTFRYRRCASQFNRLPPWPLPMLEVAPPGHFKVLGKRPEITRLWLTLGEFVVCHINSTFPNLNWLRLDVPGESDGCYIQVDSTSLRSLTIEKCLLGSLSFLNFRLNVPNLDHLQLHNVTPGPSARLLNDLIGQLSPEQSLRITMDKCYAGLNGTSFLENLIKNAKRYLYSGSGRSCLTFDVTLLPRKDLP